MVALHRFPLLPKSRRTIAVCGLLAIGGVLTTLYVLSKPTSDTVAPSYEVVLPQRTTVDDLGGWQRVSPTESDPVFAYTDEIKDVQISVSQQPIPASFAGNVEARVKQLAESYSATTVIEAGGTSVYIGRSARGPQSVIFTKNNTLILIKSQKTISQDEWVRYINTLVDPKSEKTPTF